MAAFTGLREGELVALRVKDVDFAGSSIRVRASYTYGALSTPKSGKVRAVPMVPEVAQTLAKLTTGRGDDELVFPGERGEYLDASALRRRYKSALRRAKLRYLRFHDLRHCFGSLAIQKASIVDVQSWMGHADVQTTMRYLHHKSREDDAQRLVLPALSPESAPEAKGRRRVLARATIECTNRSAKKRRRARDGRRHP